MSQWDKFFVQPVKDLFTQLMEFVPNLITCIFIIVVGWIVAKLIRWILRRFLTEIKFDQFIGKLGVSDAVKSCSCEKLPTQTVCLAAYWLTMVMVIVMALRELKLYEASFFVRDVVSYLMTVVNVAVILILGLLLSMTCSKVVLFIGQKVNISKPQIQATFVRWSVIIFTFILCLMRLGLPPQILLGIVAVSFLTLCITFIISFGMGGQVWAAKVLDKLIEKD